MKLSRLVENPVPNGAVEEGLRRITSRTPEQVEAARAALLAASTPPKPLPAGKTLEDVVAGAWPGDETDEQIRVALDELS